MMDDVTRLLWWALFGSVLLASLALPAMGKAKRNSGSSAARAPSSVGDNASDAGSTACTSGADSWLRLVSFNNHHWLSGGWGLRYVILMWWFILTNIFPNHQNPIHLKDKQIILLSSLGFGLQSTGNINFYHTTSSIVTGSWETQAYNVDLIDEYKSQCRELLDMWADIQNADALLIRDGGQEATVVL